MPAIKKCENEGCNVKLEFGRNPIYQRTKNGVSILVCQHCADKIDGIVREKNYDTGTEVVV